MFLYNCPHFVYNFNDYPEIKKAKAAFRLLPLSALTFMSGRYGCGMMKKITPFFIFLVPMLLYACAVPPDPVCEKGGIAYCRIKERFTGDWYSFYKRALSCMEGECYQEAVFELDEALKQRPGDKRWANTYGMHFMDYFPHREKGIAFYFLGDDDTAKSELELSMTSEPSAKAGFYLDKVHKRIMEREKREPGKPDLNISYPPRGFGKSDERRTRDDPVIISGAAADERYVSEIILADRSVFIENSAQQVAFREEFTLEQGIHEMDILARNLLGGEIKQKIIIHVDRAGPVILIEKFREDEIQGYVYDESGVQSFTADTDGEPKAVPIEKDGFFRIPLKIGVALVSLRAADELGNETKTDIFADTMTKNPSPFLLAQNFPDNRADAPVPLLSRSDGEPEITLKGWPAHQIVFSQTVDIEGQVESKIRITELTIEVSGRNWKLETGDRKSDIQISDIRFQLAFNQSLSLNEGKNSVRIRASDESGKTGLKEIFITRQIPQVLQPKYRYALKMYPFDNEESRGETNISGRFFSKVLVYWHPFQFMDQEKRAWFQLFLLESFKIQNRFQITVTEPLRSVFSALRELSQVSEPSEQSEPEICHSLLLADTSEDRKGIEVIARLVDIRTSEIIAVKDVYDESKERAALRSMAEKLSEKFHRTLPLTRGRIATVTENNIHALFEEQKAAEGWPLIVYREQSPERNPVTGKNLGSDTEMIADDACMGKHTDIIINFQEKIKTCPRTGVRTGDKVISR